MPLHRPSSINIVAAFAVVTSIVLGGMPWWSPSTAIAPFIMLNWVLFMTVGVLSKASMRLCLLHEQTGKHDHLILMAVLAIFSVSGFVALLNGAKIT
jgi:hypothetical protein